MTAKDIVGFQFGRAEAIRNVASSSSAIWTGIALVLMTAFARSYDQTYFFEKPFLWLLGPLLFSLVSGTWLFLVAYGLCARWQMEDADGNKPPLWRSWRGFMGAFWMTAPIAWLYAIPVERFLDSLSATKVNLALLGTVALWRVLLMARVLQVICGAPLARALLWVLLPAGVEVMAVSIFSGQFARVIMASMAGLRNSPEEDLLFGALNVTIVIGFWGTIAVALVLAIWRWIGVTSEWPALKPCAFQWPLLLCGFAFWVAVAIPAQVELRRNFAVEQSIASGDMRAAIDFMNRHSPQDFAPARPLPPKLYEYSTLEEVPRFVGALRAEDEPWVQQHCVRAATVYIQHLAGWSNRDKPLSEVPFDQLQRAGGHGRWAQFPTDLASMLAALASCDPGQEWLKTYPNFLNAVEEISNNPVAYDPRNLSEEQKKAEWQQVAAQLRAIWRTNVPSTNSPAQNP